MRKFRRIASAVAALAMIATMAVPFSAGMTASAVTAKDNGKYSITVKLDTDDTGNTDHQFTAYQIFAGDYSAKSGSQGVLSNIKWGDAFDLITEDGPTKGNLKGTSAGLYQALAELNIGVTIKGNGDTVSDKVIDNIFKKNTAPSGQDANWVNLSSAQEVAEALALLRQAEGDGTKTEYNNIDEIARTFKKFMKTGATGITLGYKADLDGDASEAEEPGYTAKTDDSGYYLIIDETDSTLAAGEVYSKYILQVVGANSEEAKASAPEVMKKVQENTLTEAYEKADAPDGLGQTTETVEVAEFAGNSNYKVGDGYNDIADWNIGDLIPFKLYGSMPETIDNYTKYKYVFHDSLGEEFDLTWAADTESTITALQSERTPQQFKDSVVVTVTTTYEIPAIETDAEYEAGKDKTKTVTVTWKLDKTAYTVLLKNEFTNSPYDTNWTHDAHTSSTANDFDIVFKDILDKTVIKGTVTANKNDDYNGVTATQRFGDVVINASSVVEVSYDAILTDEANIGIPGQCNSVYLEYSNNSNWDGKSDEDEENTTTNTPEDGVIVFTYGVDIDKVTPNADYTGAGDTYNAYDEEAGVNDSVTKLAGAVFAIYKIENGEKVYITTDENGKFYGYTNQAGIDIALATEVEDAETDLAKWVNTGSKDGLFISDGTGLMNIEGLDAGTYYIEELVAPTGYNKLDYVIRAEVVAQMVEGSTEKATSTATGTAADRQDWEYGTTDKEAELALTTLKTVYTAGKVTGSAGNFEFTANTSNSDLREDEIRGLDQTEGAATNGKYVWKGNHSKDDTTHGDCGYLQIINSLGTELPSTGGIGTTLFYVIGGVLVVGAGVTLITKKRMSSND